MGEIREGGAGKRGARFVVIALAAYLLWSGPHLIFHALTSTPIRRSPSPMVLAPVLLILAALSGGDDVTTVTVELSPWASQVHCPSEVVEPARLGTRWHDTPTSKPPASQPNSTSAGTVTRRR
jgi:hypothetical protein